MILARSCALTAVGDILATWQERKPNSVRQQLREWCYEAEAKRGSEAPSPGGRELFCALVGLGVELVGGEPLALAIDATALGARFVVLTVSVVYRGCAIPVAWTVLAGNTKHAWRGEWLRMLRQLRPGSPGDLDGDRVGRSGAVCAVVVSAQQCAWAGIPSCGSTRVGPFGRRPATASSPCGRFAPQPGTRWQGRGTAFVSRPCRLDCTLLACWEEGYKDAWFILTDLPPEGSEACWYGLRAWIEQGFKITKRGGWQWQRTRMTDPERAAGLWLAVAVATLWLLSVGGRGRGDRAAQHPARRDANSWGKRAVTAAPRGCAWSVSFAKAGT